MLVVSLSQSCRQPLPFPLSSRSPSIHYNTKCDFFKESKKETEKNGFADYYCHLQLLPLLLLQSFNRASQPNQPKNFPLTQFKWCGIVVWLGDSHSRIFSVRSFIHTFSVAFLRSFLQMPLYLMSIVSNLPLSLRNLLGKVCTCGCWAIKLLLSLLFASFYSATLWVCALCMCARARTLFIELYGSCKRECSFIYARKINKRFWLLEKRTIFSHVFCVIVTTTNTNANTNTHSHNHICQCITMHNRIKSRELSLLLLLPYAEFINAEKEREKQIETKSAWRDENYYHQVVGAFMPNGENILIWMMWRERLTHAQAHTPTTNQQ